MSQKPKPLEQVKDAILQELVRVVDPTLDSWKMEKDLMNEARLYEALGKEDARTVLAVWRQICEVEKLSRLAAVVVEPNPNVPRIIAEVTVEKVIEGTVEKAIKRWMENLERVAEYRKKLYPPKEKDV